MGSSSKEVDFIERELEGIHGEFIARLWKGMAVVAALAVPLSVFRAATSGWSPFYLLHLTLSLLVGVVVLYLHRIPRRTQAVLFVGLLWLSGAPGLFVYGMAAAGISWLVLSCLVVSTLYSRRAGIFFGLATAGVMLAAALWFVLGYAEPRVDMNAHLASPVAWATLVVVTGTFVLMTLNAYGAYTQATLRLLGQVKSQGDQIAFLSLHDPLTGLPQVRLAHDRLAMALADARRRGTGLAVMCIDLDRFKAVNDEHGHAAGDAVLSNVARRMRALLRASDTLARIGGDEFLVILPGPVSRADAATVAAKLVAAASEPVTLGEAILQVGASVGIVIAAADGDEPADLLRRADAAMYAAKHAGRNGWAFAT